MCHVCTFHKCHINNCFFTSGAYEQPVLIPAHHIPTKAPHGKRYFGSVEAQSFLLRFMERGLGLMRFSK